jgi:predicted transcriptional regulator
VYTLPGVPKKPINARIDAELLAAIDELAARTLTDRTELIERGLRREVLYDGTREFVYVLLDEAGDVRYVGRSRDPYRRMREHIAGARAGGHAGRDAWLAAMLGAGQKPRMAIVDDAEAGQAIADLEREWIERFRAGGRLTNGIAGGVAARERSGRKQFGMVDADLLARVDARAAELGQTRRVFTERALEAALSEAKGALATERSGPAPVPVQEGARPAAPPRASGHPNVTGSPALERFGR